MKVIQIVHSYYPFIGGVETHVKEISEELSKRGIQVEIYTTDPTGDLPREEIVGGISVKRFRSWAPNGCYFVPFPEMWIAFRKIHADIIHVHCIHDLHAPFAFLFLPSKETIYLTPHYCGQGGSFVRRLFWRLYRPVLRILIRRASLITCVSKYEKQLIRKEFNIPKQKIVVVPNGIDVRELKKIKNQVIMQKPTIRNDVTTILYVGRIDEKKNVGEIISAISILHEERERNIKLTIVGSGRLVPRLKKVAKQKGVSKIIEWKQNIPRELLLEEYAKASIFVFPSEIEAFGLAVCEAIAMGVPTIVANAGALSELVSAGLATGIDPPITSKKIAKCITETLNEVPVSGQEISFKAWSQVAQIMFNLYRSVGKNSLSQEAGITNSDK